MGHSMLKADKVGGFLTIILGIVSLTEAIRQFPMRMNFFVGDHTLPGLIGSTMVLLGLLLLLLKLEDGKVVFPKGVTLRKLLGTLIIMFVYWYLISTLGYIISTFLVLAALFRVIGSYHVAKSLLYGGITTVALYLLFIFWLQMPFPKGMLGF